MNVKTWAMLCVATVMIGAVAGCGQSAERAYSDPATAPRNAGLVGAAEGAEAQADPATDGLSPAQHEAAKAAGVPVHLTNSIGMKLILIPPGEFMMGSPDSEEKRGSHEGPQHQVRITKPFYLGVYQVTQEEYERVMGTNPSYFKTASGQDTSRFPVEQVSWDDALKFCRKLSALPSERSAGREYRLPTEAEWEYACRAGTTTPFHFGSVLNGRQANHDGNRPYGTSEKGPYLERTTTVGSYSANGFGLYDMHGNVWEWCADWYDEEYYANSPVDDPQGPASGSDRVYRGGCWGNSAGSCRSASRRRLTPVFRGINLGFRLALVPADE